MFGVYRNGREPKVKVTKASFNYHLYPQEFWQPMSITLSRKIPDGMDSLDS